MLKPFLIVSGVLVALGGCVGGSSSSPPSSPAPCNLEYNLALVKPLPNTAVSPIAPMIYIASTTVIAPGAGLSVVAPPSSPIPGGTLVGPVPAPSPTPPLFQNPIFYESQFPNLINNKKYVVTITASNCETSRIPGAVFTTATPTPSPTPTPTPTPTPSARTR